MTLLRHSYILKKEDKFSKQMSLIVNRSLKFKKYIELTIVILEIIKQINILLN